MSSFRRGQRPLVVLLLAFVSLATLYNVANPIFEAPDELWHFRFVRNLATGQGLPVLQEDPEQNPAGQEGGQPPLYYALTAVAIFWIDSSDIDSVSVASAYRRGLGKGPNVVVHTSREDFPYQGTALAVHVARAVSTLIGAGTVLLVYLLALEVLKGRRRLALWAAGLIASIPQFLFLSASVSNDNLVTLISALALLLCLRLLRGGLGRTGFVVLAVLVGIAPLAKVSGLAVATLVAVALVLEALRNRRPLPVFPVAMLAAALVVFSGWWFARNWGLYGDPTGMTKFIQASGGASPALSLDRVWVETQRLWLSTWGLFGWSNVPADFPVYALYGLVCVLALVGLARLLYVRGERATLALPLAFLALWIVVFLLLLAQYMRMISGVQGRMLFPALPAVAVLLIAGLSRLLARPPAGRPVTAALAAMLVLPGLLAPFLYIIPAYPRPVLLGGAQIAAITSRLDLAYGQHARLLGYKLSDPDLVPGRPVELTLYWQAIAPAPRDYSVFVHLIDPQGNPVGGYDGPLLPSYPATAWQTGDAVQETYSIQPGVPTQTPSSVRIEVGLYIFPGLERVPVSSGGAAPMATAATIARLRFPGPAVQPPSSGRSAMLGAEVQLAGYRAGESRLAPGGMIRGTVWWKAIARLGRDYTVFVQLLGLDGLVAQYDSQPLAGAYPTSLWVPGEIVEDYFELKLPENLSTGDYRIIAGMYDAVTGARLGDRGADHVVLDDLRLDDYSLAP